MPTMQDALGALTSFWAGQGCILLQPVNTEVGAGTLNPATFLRVLGPEPWRVAYVEPSVRPDDSRYGDNPNRIQTHTQFQVVLKPEPGDAQRRYLDSLRALGIDVDAHDVRFVEDDWASPALGAWGLGWEVWLDGLEITQFTYFQQAGGVTLDPVSVELTYGMERILMALQGVRHFKEIAVAPGISYGEVFGQAEREMSRYYLDEADIATTSRLLEAYEAEARRLIRARLPVPAHGFVLKCSHAFNVLDARGAVSTAERASAFARIRGLARQVAELWMARRAEEGHPLGVVAPPAAPPLPAAAPLAEGPATLLLEIGVEELPAAEVATAAEAVRGALEERLDSTRLGHGPVRAYATPRRMIALVDAVQPREQDHRRTVRGPRVTAAFGPDGAPTAAALGFARAHKVEVADLERLEVGGVEHLGVVHRLRGRRADQVLAEVLAAVVSGLRAEKNMRWHAPGLAYARPVRWLLALLGEAVVPFAVSSLASGATTRLPHGAGPAEVPVPAADGYLDFLAAHGVVADPGQRRRSIVERAAALAAGVGGTVDPAAEADLIGEVANLVERPAPLLGGFDERYLALPDEVLATVMRKHQRYLPVHDRDGRLLPRFVAVADGTCDEAVVRAGNEDVLRARFEDAAFFWRLDLQSPPEAMKAGLATLLFQEQLGSMADRAGRIAATALTLAPHAGLTGQELATLRRAAELAKFDLASALVVELPALAGVMAREYARRSGEPEPVAQALFELELPRHAGDRLPRSAPGALLAVADRLDLLAGLFAVGVTPSGRSDPFGLRRAALGVLGILRSQPRLAGITLADGLAVAGRQQPVEWTDRSQAEALEFTLRRYERQLLDAGHDHRVVRAVLPAAVAPARADATAAELVERLGDPAFGRVAETMQRACRIVPAGTAAAYDPLALTEPAEVALHQALGKVRAELEGREAGLTDLARAAGALVAPVEAFFDGVLVMVEDPATRRNRLGLLASICELGAGVLDWSALG